MTAAQILRTAADTIEARGRVRDSGQERSMKKTIDTFNALTGHRLTEEQGWQFMVLLKLARQQSAHDPDNYIDASAYAALAGECRAEPEVACGLYRDIPVGRCVSCEED